MGDFLQRNLIFLISCMDLFAVSLIIPLFTEHLKSIGFSNMKIGILNSMYSGTQFFASPLLGHLSDVYGSRCVLIVSLLICSVCYPLVGCISSFIGITCVRMFLGLVKHTQLLCKNYIQENEEEDDHIKSFGKLSGYTSLGYIVGPIIGGYLMNFENGFFYMCCLTGLFFAINSIFAYHLNKSRKQKIKVSPASRSFITSFKNIPWSLCWDLFLLKCLSVFAMYSFYLNYNSSLTNRFALSSVSIGYSFSFQGLVRAITGFKIHKILKLFPINFEILSKIQITYLLLIGSFIALYFSSYVFLYLLFLVPFNVCLCFIRIVNHEGLVERTKNYNKGIILGAFNNITAICRFILPLVSGYIVDNYGSDSVYIVSITSLVLGIVIISFRSNLTRIKVD